MLPVKDTKDPNLVPSKTAEAKDPHLSLSKALEAVVAAGKRGLLGPAAMEAAAAIPEVNQGGPGRGVSQEAANAIPPLCPDIVAVKKKKINESRPSLITIVPTTKGEGSLQPAPKEVWICGNSVVVAAKKRAQSQPYGSQLGIPTSRAHVYWRAVQTMRWEQLLPVLHQSYHLQSSPSIIIIHVGEDDLLPKNIISLLMAMKNDLGILKRALGPRKEKNLQEGAVIIWSSLLPKQVWGKDLNPEDMEVARIQVNTKMAAHCNEIGVHFLSHNLFTSNNTDLFLPNSNDLSDAGADLFIADLKKVLRFYSFYG